jgi:hypothetical protein
MNRPTHTTEHGSALCDCPPVHDERVPHQPTCSEQECAVMSCDACGGPMPECTLVAGNDDETLCPRCANDDEWFKSGLGDAL